MSGADIRGRLQQVARPVAAHLERARARRAAWSPVGLGLPLVAFPLGYLALIALTAPFGADARLPWLALVPLTLVWPACRIWTRWQLARGRRVAERAALARVDDELALHDRLTAAHEFAGDDDAAGDGFKQLAIRDAERYVAEAAEARPDDPVVEADDDAGLRLGWAGFAAWVLLLLAGAVPLADAGSGDVTDGQPATRGEVAAVDRPDDPPIDPETEVAPEPRREPDAASRRAATDDQASNAGEDPSPTETERRGKNPLGSGRSAEARTSAGGGSERGQPSNQAQSTKGDAAKKPKERKKKESRRDDDERAEVPKQPPEESGSTQGRGSGKGSSKSPTASPWSAKDRVVTDDEQEPDEDEEVDDENDESKARGGVQPNLRARKPPVNRDLQISMGNGQPPDDANGRGGPGGPKKQRGVAQLVLGVTFPDHVSAKPNPGISKITQERIEPQAQDADRLDGEARGRRTASMGHLSRRVLAPWMQDLVRTYYLGLRKGGDTQ